MPVECRNKQNGVGMPTYDTKEYEQGLWNAKKSIMELGYALMTQKSKSKICGMHTKRRMELGCALITLNSKSKVCGMHKKSRLELRCALMTLKSKSKFCKLR